MATRCVEDRAAFRIVTLFEPRGRRDARRERSRAGLSLEAVESLRVGEDESLTLADGTPAIRLFLETGRGDAEEVRLTTTRCHFEGARLWMACECGQRCAGFMRRRDGEAARKGVLPLPLVGHGVRREMIPGVVAELRRLSREPETRFESNSVARIVVGIPSLRDAIDGRWRDRVTDDWNEPTVPQLTESDGDDGAGRRDDVGTVSEARTADVPVERGLRRRERRRLVDATATDTARHTSASRRAPYQLTNWHGLPLQEETQTAILVHHL